MKHRKIEVKVHPIKTGGHITGLDIGATSVRAATLAPGMQNGQPLMTSRGLGVIALPPGAVMNGVVKEPTLVTKAIRQLWDEHRFPKDNVILGITHQQSVVRDLDMPRLSPEFLVKALPYQAREIVPFPMEQAILDFLPLSAPNPQTDMVRGLLIAVPRAPVLAAVHAVEKAGLEVARVDLSSFALLRSITDPRYQVEAVIDMGYHMTNIVIHESGVPRVVRTLSRGGNDLTDRIADRTGLSASDAEIAKCLNGLIGADREIVEVITEAVRPLFAEIRSSLNYFSSANASASPQRVSLTGRAANLPGLAELLSDQLGITVEVVAPMQHISNRWDADALRDSPDHAATAVSVGLAMGAAA